MQKMMGRNILKFAIQAYLKHKIKQQQLILAHHFTWLQNYSKQPHKFWITLQIFGLWGQSSLNCIQMFLYFLEQIFPKYKPKYQELQNKLQNKKLKQECQIINIVQFFAKYSSKIQIRDQKLCIFYKNQIRTDLRVCNRDIFIIKLNKMK